MKQKYCIILALLLITIIFANSCKLSAIATKKEEQQIKQTQQVKQKDDFGCWPPSCSFIPDAQGKQMCEDWKAGKQVQWPPDCSMMQYGPCIKLCEFEKQGTASGGEQKQSFNVLPSLLKAELANDVNEEDKNFVIRGISATDFYLQKWFGKSINQPAMLRVYAAESTPIEGGAKVEVENGKMVILIGTKSDIWKNMIEVNKYGGESRNKISAHEYVHVYQFHNGCGNAAADTYAAPKWFLEGEAEWLSYKVMHETRLVPSLGFPEYSILPLAKQETGLLKSFEKVEKGGLTVSRYSFYTMAVDYLMKDRQKKALDDFCVNLADGKGMSMPKAFETAFGITLDKFYEDFESYRKTW